MTLKNVLEEICAEEYALPANAPAHRFKRRHRRAVNAVLYPDGLPKTERKLKLKRRILVASVIVVLAVVTGAAAGYYHYNGFGLHKTKVGDFKFYEMFLENKNKENSPKTIEKIIYDDNMPEDFTFKRTVTIDEEGYEDIFIYNEYVAYDRINKWGGQGVLVNIWQYTKPAFVSAINEKDIVAPIEVKGCKGITITADDDYGTNSILWDSGDYIHIVDGLMSVEELIEIVENMIEN